ncbi:hypothetical protein BKA62DRAFT_719066 [Auriculariales sp. MPI-PUGE-AT-0066]|nr:hypothetical protein BKA62DRAFT_719066 [Auriculariales sp. MPI-PUGE-AT-0066]
MNSSANLSGTAVKLPLELLYDVLELAAKSNRFSDPAWTIGLATICRTAREWLYPVLYRVFIVRLPDELDRRSSPSWKAFVKMLLNVESPQRRHVRNLVFWTKHQRTRESAPFPGVYLPKEPLEEGRLWELDCLVADAASAYDLVDTNISRLLRPRTKLTHPAAYVKTMLEISISRDGTARTISELNDVIWCRHSCSTVTWGPQLKTLGVAMEYSGVRILSSIGLASEDAVLHLQLHWTFKPSDITLNPFARALADYLTSARIVLYFYFAVPTDPSVVLEMLRNQLTDYCTHSRVQIPLHNLQRQIYVADEAETFFTVSRNDKGHSLSEHLLHAKPLFPFPSRRLFDL